MAALDHDPAPESGHRAPAPCHPQRIQLSRAKGFNLQAASLALNGLPAVVVARPSRWGNPFVVGAYVRLGHNLPVKIRNAETAAALFRMTCEERAPDLSALRGKNLACWCELPAPWEPDHCHAAILLELANPNDGAAPRHPLPTEPAGLKLTPNPETPAK